MIVSPAFAAKGAGLDVKVAEYRGGRLVISGVAAAANTTISLLGTDFKTKSKANKTFAFVLNLRDDDCVATLATKAGKLELQLGNCAIAKSFEGQFFSASVQSNGVLKRSFPAEGVTVTKSFVSQFKVDFGVDVSECFLTSGTSSNGGEVAIEVVQFVRSTDVTIVEVFTFAGPDPLAVPFDLVVFCPPT